MDARELELVFFFVVEENAVLFQKGGDWHFPTRRAQKADNHVEKPLGLLQESAMGEHLLLLGTFI